MDQKEIYAYLKEKLEPSESRSQLFKAASVARQAGWTFMEASFQLGDKASNDGLDHETIETIIRKAFSQERRTSDRLEEKERLQEATTPSSTPLPPQAAPANYRPQLDFDQDALAMLQRQHIDPDDLSIPWPSDDWRKDLVKLLKELFAPEDLIAFKKAGTPNSIVEQTANILSQESGINKIMRTLDGEDGALLRINAISPDEGEKAPANYRYALIDNTSMQLSKQLAYFKALNLPCAALVNTGANSAQAWIRIDAKDADEYVERVNFLYDLLSEQGFNADTANKNPLQMVRMPGVLRQGKQQYLISLNEGAKSWQEWKDWAEYSLDGDPLAELASYHHTPPRADMELVENIFYKNQSLLLQGPPKIGKSYLLLDLAYSLCYGEPWLEHYTKESDVLFVSLEQDKAALINRMHRIAEARNLAPDTAKMGFFHLKSFPKKSLDFAQFLVKRIQGARKHEGRDYKVVIIDPLTKLLPTSVRSEAQISMIMRQIVDQITASAEVSVIASLSSRFSVDTSWSDGLLTLSTDGDKTILEGTFRESAPLASTPLYWNFPLFSLKN
jgi:archaellum biogenesis ATPase FlaH